MKTGGEQLVFSPDNKITVGLDTSGLTKEQEGEILDHSAVAQWIQEENLKHPGTYVAKIDVSDMKAKDRWNAAFYQKHPPKDVIMNEQPGLAKGLFWWIANREEVFTYWSSYRSWWVPLGLFANENLDRLTETFYQASRLYAFSFQLN